MYTALTPRRSKESNRTLWEHTMNFVLLSRGIYAGHAPELVIIVFGDSNGIGTSNPARAVASGFHYFVRTLALWRLIVSSKRGLYSPVELTKAGLSRPLDGEFRKYRNSHRSSRGVGIICTGFSGPAPPVMS